MSLLNAFNPNHLSQDIRRKSPLAIQREIILQYLFNAITGFGVLALLVYLASNRIDLTNIVLIIPFIITIIIQVAFTVSRRLPYQIRAVALLLMIAVPAFASFFSLGLSGSFLIYAITFVAVITVLFGSRPGGISLILISLLAVVVGGMILTGRMPSPGVVNPDMNAQISAWINEFLAFLLTAASIAGAFNQLTSGLTIALTEQQTLAQRIENERAQLEVNVQNRTKELSHKTTLLEAARQVSTLLAAESNTDTLLSRAAAVIQEQFKLNLVNIYMKAPNQDTMVLKAWAGSLGLELNPDTAEINLSQPGVVSYVAQRGLPYLSTGFHQDLPGKPFGSASVDIIAEVGVPIKTGDQTSGILDLQSKHAEEFNPDDLDIFTTLANQLSTALENAHLFQELEQELLKTENRMRQATQKDWYSHLKASKRRYAFRFSQDKQDTNLLQTEESTQALQNGMTVISAPAPGKSSKVVAVPIKIRNQTLGVLNLRVSAEECRRN